MQSGECTSSTRAIHDGPISMISGRGSGMRLPVSILLFTAALHADVLPFFSVPGEGGAWPDILNSIGLQRTSPETARIFVAPAGTPATTEWKERVGSGAIVILEGESPLA